MVKIAENLKNMDVQLDVILTSPYVRTFETAKIVAKTFAIRKRNWC